MYTALSSFQFASSHVCGVTIDDHVLQAMGEHMDAYHDYVSAIRLNRTKCAYFSCRYSVIICGLMDGWGIARCLPVNCIFR